MKRLFAVFLFSILLSGCMAHMQVVETGANGYFPGSKNATVVKNDAFDVDSRRALLLAPNGDFTAAMARNIGYFEEVINFEELEKRIVQNELSDKIPSVRDRIGVNNAAKHYQPFLWLHWDTRREGNAEYLQLILTDPLTLEDLFIAETFLDRVWAGVNDRNNRYPPFNALIDYLDKHSETFRK